MVYDISPVVRNSYCAEHKRLTFRANLPGNNDAKLFMESRYTDSRKRELPRNLKLSCQAPLMWFASHVACVCSRWADVSKEAIL
jgi:hypothetical protein